MNAKEDQEMEWKGKRDISMQRRRKRERQTSKREKLLRRERGKKIEEQRGEVRKL